ncbi:Syo1 protein [Saccharomycopsis crataegensis]|uniref:Syo1 protein n=1 Tax=Saccharomycopsis crataegensis TaxID=43959 RepID=A0AAV5QKG8_9ASCO|nr:Syo1 protein [Saccharomycopsis crataegensis]
MGKSKKKSRISKILSGGSPFPTVGQSNDSTTNNQLPKESKHYSTVHKLISQLNSTIASPNDKIIALNSIVVMCNDPSLREEFFKQNILGLLFSNDPLGQSTSTSKNYNNDNAKDGELQVCFLNSKNLDIVNSTLELLKIIVFEDGYAMSTHLWKKRRIWKYIDMNLNNLKNSFNEFSMNMTSFNNSQKVLLFELTENIFGLIIALINGSESILDEILTNNADNEKMNSIAEFAVNLLKWCLIIDDENKNLKVSLRLFNTLLDLIYDFSSESGDFIERLIFNYGFSLQKLIEFGAMIDDTKINSVTRIYIENIKFQVFEVAGVQLALAGASANDDQDQVVKDFEAKRDQIFIEIYQNLSGYLKQSSKTLDVMLAATQLNPADYANVDSPEFMAKHNEKSKANDEIQAMEISLDLIATIVEFAGTNPALEQLIESSSDNDSQIIEYFNNNKLINSFLDAEFFEFLYQCLVNYNYKFELHALDCFINLAILFGSLSTTDLPSIWKDQAEKYWSSFITNQATSPFFRALKSFNGSNTVDGTVIYNLHTQIKTFGFLNASVKILQTTTANNEQQEQSLITFVQALINNGNSFSTINYHIQLLQSQPKKKKKSNHANSAENKEFVELIGQYYQEFLQLLVVLAQLPLVNLNGIIGDYLFNKVLNPVYQSAAAADEAPFAKEPTSMLDILPPRILIDLISSVFDIYSDKSFVYDGPNFVNKNYSGILKSLKEVLKSDIFKRKIDKNVDANLKALSYATIKELDRFIKYKDHEN